MIVGLFWGCMMLRAWSQFTSDALQFWAETFPLPDVAARAPAPPPFPPTPCRRSVDDLLGEVFPDGVGV
jgi:hypothetical protein